MLMLMKCNAIKEAKHLGCYRKLQRKWEGPYKVISTSSHGAVTLQNDKGTLFKVNGQRLKVFLDTQLLEEELDIINFIEFK
jgi:hypothetical protein